MTIHLIMVENNKQTATCIKGKVEGDIDIEIYLMNSKKQNKMGQSCAKLKTNSVYAGNDVLVRGLRVMRGLGKMCKKLSGRGHGGRRGKGYHQKQRKYLEEIDWAKLNFNCSQYLEIRMSFDQIK